MQTQTTLRYFSQCPQLRAELPMLHYYRTLCSCQPRHEQKPRPLQAPPPLPNTHPDKTGPSPSLGPQFVLSGTLRSTSGPCCGTRWFPIERDKSFLLLRCILREVEECKQAVTFIDTWTINIKFKGWSSLTKNKYLAASKNFNLL